MVRGPSPLLRRVVRFGGLGLIGMLGGLALLHVPPLPGASGLLLPTTGLLLAAGALVALARILPGSPRPGEAPGPQTAPGPEEMGAVPLGPYLLEARLGEGSRGTVFRARHAHLGHVVAVKALPAWAADEAALDRFEREVRLTRALSHPHIIAVHDSGPTPEGVFYYAMEYVDGFDLETLVRQDGPQPPGRVRALLLQAARALAEAHARGVLHRDIKPSNLLLGGGGPGLDVLKVADFGLAKERSQDEELYTSAVEVLIGTPLYLSPEALTQQDGPEPRSDLYSLGAVGYFLLTGTPVFQRPSVMQVCADHLLTPPRPPSERLGRALPRSLERVVLACLAKEKQARPASAEALVALLEACDDVPAWTPEDARRWWTKRGEPLRAQVRATQAEAFGVTLRRMGLAPRQEA